MINLYPKHSNKQLVHRKFGDTHILVVIWLSLVREHYEYQECCCGEILVHIAHVMRNKNSNSVNAMRKPFIYHSFY